MIIIKPGVGVLKILNDKKMFIPVLHENIYISEALGPIMGVYSLALIFSLPVINDQGSSGRRRSRRLRSPSSRHLSRRGRPSFRLWPS